jgi:hypothetical protein
MIRYAVKSNKATDTNGFDAKLNEAITWFERETPERWEVVLDYLRSMAYLEQVNPEQVDLVCAEYHRKQYALRIVRRLNGLEVV